MCSFLQNKYTRWYESIIEKRRHLTPVGYSEYHHITPRSLGGSNEKDNLIQLTPCEHFLCHWLLTKMTIGRAKAKMWCALWYMANLGCLPRSSRAYDALRTSFSVDPDVRAMRSQVTTEQWKRDDVRQSHALAELRPETKLRRQTSSHEANNRPEVVAQRTALWNDPNFRARHSERTKEATNAPEAKQRMLATIRREDIRQKRSATQKVVQNKPEVRNKRSASLKRFIALSTFEERCKNSSTNKPVMQLDIETGDIINTFQSAAEAFRQTGVAKVKDAARGSRPHAGGYRWAYMEVTKL